MTNQYITREKLARINDSLPDDLGVHHLVALCNAAIQDYIDSITDGVELPEPIGYLAWLGGKPCWDGDDCVCEDAVYPIDADDDRESKAIYTPDQLRQAQAMARAKLLAELGDVEAVAVVKNHNLQPDDYGQRKQGNGCPARETKETKMTHTTESLIERLRKLSRELTGFGNVCMNKLAQDGGIAIIELLDDLEARDRRIAELEAERKEMAKRFVSFAMVEHSQVCTERDTLRAELDALRGQEPAVFICHKPGTGYQTVVRSSSAADSYRKGGYSVAGYYAAPVAPAQLAELQSGDELPEPYKWGSDKCGRHVYTTDQLRQAQAIARAKLLAELGQPQGEVVAWAYRLRNASGWGGWITTVFGGRKPQQANWQEIEVRPLVYGDAHHQEDTVPMFTRPLPAQDVNAELVKVLKLAEESMGAFVSDHGWAQRDMDNLDTVIAALANAKAAPQPPQEKKES